MNKKMTTNSQLLTTESKTKANKQTTRIGTKSQKWRSHGELSAGSRTWERGGKGTEGKNHNQLVQNRQGELKNSMENE